MPVVARGVKRSSISFLHSVLASVLVLDSHARMLWESISMFATLVMRDDCYYYFVALLIRLTLIELANLSTSEKPEAMGGHLVTG
jgi:hypothetical protein